MKARNQFFLLLRSVGPRKWILLVALGVVLGLFEATTTALIFGILGLVIDPERSVSVPVLNDLLGTSGSDSSQLLTTLCVLAIALFLIRGVLYVTQSYFQAKFAFRAGAALAGRLLRGYMSMPYVLHLRRNSAELINNIRSTATDLANSVFIPAVVVGTEGLLVLAIMIVLFLAAPSATVITLGLLIPVSFVIIRIIHPRLARLGSLNHRLESESLRSLQQTINSVREVRLLGRTQFFDQRFMEIRDLAASVMAKRNLLLDLPRVTIETVLMLFVLGFIGYAVARGDAGSRSIVLLALFAYGALRILPSLNKMLANANAFRFGSGILNALQADLQLFSSSEEPHRGDRGLPFQNEIKLEGITFRYEDSPAPALETIDLSIRRNESVGIVGTTGAGKSTLVDVILGLLKPSEGMITVDGVDIRGDLSKWYASLGVVSQSVYLMDETLIRNVAFGLEDDEIDLHQVDRVVRLAQLEPFVQSLPNGLQTIIGESGVRLSGGQRQRIAIARALYLDPPVLVFDEATSALDSATEKQLLESVRSVKRDRTLIMVAHRLSTVRPCDRIVVIDEGRVVATGTYDELVARSAEFRRLAG